MKRTKNNANVYEMHASQRKPSSPPSSPLRSYNWPAIVLFHFDVSDDDNHDHVDGNLK